MQDDLSNYSEGDDKEPYEIDLGDLLAEHFADFEWNYEGVLKQNGDVIPVPATSTCVTAIFETDSVEELRDLTDEYDIEIIEPEHSRQYPDVTLTGGALGSHRIALDIKTARRSHTNDDKLDGPMTLGSYAGYFQNPYEESPWTKFPYGTYDEHWILCFAHYWDEDGDSLNMVSGTETIIGEKWTLASKQTGTGTTNHMASVRNISDLNAGDGDFDSEEEFEEYWRSYD
jgi:hypothetical protein